MTTALILGIAMSAVFALGAAWQVARARRMVPARLRSDAVRPVRNTGRRGDR